MNKYGNKKITVDGIQFDSRSESQYYEYLKGQRAKGLIKNYELQPKYELIPAFTKDGKKYRPITYTPDFLIYHNDDSLECIDVKSMGTDTQQGILRMKMYNYFYKDIKLTWVCRNLKHGNADGWVLYEDLKAIYAKRKKAGK